MRSLRSGRHGSAFSLFAFQDILTTTIGIVLLIMLLLVLEISKEAASVEKIPEVITKLKTEKVLSKIKDISVRVVVILENNSIENATKQIRGEIKRDQQEIRMIIQNVINLTRDREFNPITPKINSIHKQINEVALRIEILKESIIIGFKNSEFVTRLAKLQTTRERLEHKLEGVLANESLVYIQQDDPNHTPFLVEISKDIVCIHSHGIATGMVDFRFTHKDEDERVAAAVATIVQLVTDRYYPLILVRPGGGYISDLIRAHLVNKQISAGIDLLVEGQTSIPEHLVTEMGSP